MQKFKKTELVSHKSCYFPYIYLVFWNPQSKLLIHHTQASITSVVKLLWSWDFAAVPRKRNLYIKALESDPKMSATDLPITSEVEQGTLASTSLAWWRTPIVMFQGRSVQRAGQRGTIGFTWKIIPTHLVRSPRLEFPTNWCTCRDDWKKTLTKSCNMFL